MAGRFADFIPPDYLTARERFRSAVAIHEIKAESFSVTAAEDLTIDIARLGTSTANKLVVISGGLHGIEGPFGTGVQLAVLAEQWPVDVGVLLIHALNPSGYFHCRRADGENVDLNRNFLKANEPYRGVPIYHHLVDPVINPPRPPRRLDFFVLRLWWLKQNIGMRALRQAVAGGQYENPQGLFFGGHDKSATMRILETNMPRWIGSAKQVIHLDFHTGLGPSGTHKLLIEHPNDSERYARCRARFGPAVESCGGPTAYTNRGGIDEWIESRFPNIQIDSICAEFGTYPVLRVLKALRYENLAYHYTKAGSHDRVHSAAQLRETFVPADRRWRETVIRDGLDLVRRAVDSLKSSPDDRVNRISPPSALLEPGAAQ